MSVTLELTVGLKKDGKEVDGFPLVRRLVTDEAQGFEYEQAVSVPFVALPTDRLDNVKALLVRADRAVILRLDGQSDAGIELDAGGLLLLLGATINVGAGSNATLSNQSGGTAVVEGFAAGT